jgi:cob(I)alamin adenosyltransferase
MTTVTADDARDDLEEANAALGAALSMTSLPAELQSLLTGVQHDLLGLTEAVTSGRAGPPDDRLEAALDRYGNPGSLAAEIPAAFSVLGGFNQGAGLLKSARMITRRAARTVSSLAEPPADALVYLRKLADLLLVAAFRAEQWEAALTPWGLCSPADLPLWSDQH